MIDREYQLIRKVGNYEILYHPSIRACGERPGDTDRFFIKEMTDDFQIYETVYPKGYQENEMTYELPCDLKVLYNFALPMRDGVKLYCDVFMPVTEEPLPAVVNWTPFGKSYERDHADGAGYMMMRDGTLPVKSISGFATFEGTDPAWWAKHGYITINVDIRGGYFSEGNAEYFGNGQDSDDIYDAVEYIAAQPWCNGKVAMAGASWLAICQYYAAAKHPPHLACIAPWEGHGNMYRDEYVLGGIPNVPGARNYFTPGLTYQEDIRNMIEKYPVFNDYWASKAVNWEDITCPVYMIASPLGGIHNNGAYEGFERISSKEKWLRVHNTDHNRELFAEESCQDLLKFFDRYLKDMDNGWEDTPKVRMTVLDFTGEDIVHRPEADYPLPQQQVKTLYLDAQTGTMGETLPEQEAQCGYSCGEDRPYYTDAMKELQEDDGTGKVKFVYQFQEDTEITGYIKLRVWAEVHGHDEMDLYLRILTRDENGQILTKKRGHGEFFGPDARIRGSLREPDPKTTRDYRVRQHYKNPQRFHEGEIVPIDVLFVPCSQIFHKGQSLELVIAGYDFLTHQVAGGAANRWIIYNRGQHVFHTGGQYDSHLMIPVIPK